MFENCESCFATERFVNINKHKLIICAATNAIYYLIKKQVLIETPV